jgi:hypothetical protein
MDAGTSAVGYHVTSDGVVICIINLDADRTNVHYVILSNGASVGPQINAIYGIHNVVCGDSKAITTQPNARSTVNYVISRDDVAVTK